MPALPARLVECDLGPVIPPLQPHVAVLRRPPARDGVAAFLAAFVRVCGAIVLGLVLVGIAAGVSIYASTKAKAAICALDTMTREEAIEMARALRFDLVAARKEIAAPALSPEDRKILLLRLDRRQRFADRIIACEERP